MLFRSMLREHSSHHQRQRAPPWTVGTALPSTTIAVADYDVQFGVVPVGRKETSFSYW